MERYVIDGDYLTRKQKWKKGDTCKIDKEYADFTIKTYGLATVVLVGHDAGPPIKNNAHKRNQQNMHECCVHFVGDVEFESQQEEFLSMRSSKQLLIKSISEEMVVRGCMVFKRKVMLMWALQRSLLTVHRNIIPVTSDLLILLLC